MQRVNDFDEYIMYLRKSRMDTDFDEVSVEETLNRHKAILTEFAKNRNLHVAMVLEGEIKELQSGIEELEEICHNKSEYRQAQEIFLPTTAHVLDYYDRMTPEEKNRLWKLLMEKITYYRNPEKPDSIEIHLYPRLGRLISIS